MTEPHAPAEDLAAYAAGDLDATHAVAVEAHLLLCPDCRAEVDAVTRATAALAALPPAPMPADVAARIDAALATEPTGRAPRGTVLPARPKRRFSFAPYAAVAAGVALIAALAVPLFQHTKPTADRSAGPQAASAPELSSQRRLSSNLDYTHDTLGTTLARALNGATAAPLSLAGGPTAPAPATPLPSARGSGAGTGASDAVTTAKSARLAALSTDPGRLAACVEALVGTAPPAGRTPLVVDFARYAGRPALVLVFPTIREGRVRPDKLDVYVAGPGCGAIAGGDFIDFVRIDRPA